MSLNRSSGYTLPFRVYVPPRGRINGANCTINRPLSSPFPPLPRVDATWVRRTRLGTRDKKVVNSFMDNGTDSALQALCTILEQSWRRAIGGRGRSSCKNEADRDLHERMEGL